MKRSIGAAAAAIVLVVGLSACGGGGGGGGSGNASGFCDKVRGATIGFDNVDFTNTEQAKKAAVALRDIANSAPGEIKPDALKLADALDKFVAGDISEFLTAEKQQELTTASDNVTRYIKEECGIDINTPSSS